MVGGVDLPQGRVGVGIHVAQEHPAGAVAAGVVDGDLQQHRRAGGELERGVVGGLNVGVGQRAARRGHPQRQVAGGPGVAGHRQGAGDLLVGEGVDHHPGRCAEVVVVELGRGHVVVDKAAGLVVGVVRKKRQGRKAVRVVDGFEADVNRLVGGPALLNAQAALGPAEAEGERGEGTQRAVLDVVVKVVHDGFAWVREGRRGTVEARRGFQTLSKGRLLRPACHAAA